MITIKTDTINSVLKGLNISNDRYRHILFYIERMIKDYKGCPTDIIKEIGLNLKGNERYFAIFFTGVTFSPTFLSMNTNNMTTFIVDMTTTLKFSNERVFILTEYISDKIRKQKKEHIPITDVIKEIMYNNEFTNVEKDYITFIAGMSLA